MRFRALAALPWILGALLLVVSLCVPDAARSHVLGVSSEIVKLLGLAGCASAALAFERGDYMRRAWALNGACFALLVLRDLTIYFPPHLASIVALRGLLVTLANLSSVLGTWRMASALSAAGLGFPGDPRRRAGVMAAAVVCALAITGVPLALDVKSLLGGDAGAIVAIASDAGDVLSLCFLAPMLLTALAMRGGLLRWPWGLLAGGLFAWLFYDATAPLAQFVAIAPSTLSLAREVLRTLACTFVFSAAIAHRLVVNWVPSRASRPA
jgi:hypothetical protein